MADSVVVADWFRHVESDLAIADRAPGSGVLLEHLCFHAQQAAEKAVKAVLISFGVVPPKVHDIERLFSLVGEHVDVPEDVREGARLSPYAAITRYPADLGEVDEAEWRRSVALARRVAAWARGVTGHGI